MSQRKNNSLSKTFLNKRKTLGLSQSGIAKELGITQSHYQKVEAGNVSLSLEQYFRICEILQLGPSSALHKLYEKKNFNEMVLYFQKEFEGWKEALIFSYRVEIHKKDLIIFELKKKLKSLSEDGVKKSSYRRKNKTGV